MTTPLILLFLMLEQIAVKQGVTNKWVIVPVVGAMLFAWFASNLR